MKSDRVDLEIDEVVGAVSLVWAILSNNGQLLTDRDLLQGHKVRPMAKDLSRDWAVISNSLTLGSSCLEDIGLIYKVTFASINSLSLLWAWIVLARKWADSAKLGVVEFDTFDKLLDESIRKYADRWILLSQWAGRWGMASGKILAAYASGLSEDWLQISSDKTEHDVLNVLEILEARMEKWLGDLRKDASQFIQSLAAEERTAVRQYLVPLWLWHRLDKKRFEYSQKPLKHDPKKKSVKSEVDHIVAVKIWDDKLLEQQSKADITDDEIDRINHLGNCILLEKSFNISKGKQSLRSFLEEVHEFKSKKISIDDWAATMSISSALLEAPKFDCTEIQAAIDARGKAIKKELLEFVDGIRERADIF